MYYQCLLFAATMGCTIYVFQRSAPTCWYLGVADLVFVAIFVFDILTGTTQVALGVINFWRYDVFNKIDFVTSFLFLLYMALHSLGFVYSFRSMRVFRIFKPMLRLRSFAGIRAIFFSVVTGTSSLASILFILALSLLVLDVVGVEFCKCRCGVSRLLYCTAFEACACQLHACYAIRP